MSIFMPKYRLVALLAATGASLAAHGIQTAELTGEIRDIRGAAVASAKVILTSPSLQGQRVFASDEKGRFTARLLPPGDYAVQILKEGFQTVTVRQKLALGESYSPRFTLQDIGNAVVEISASLAQLDKSSVSSSSNFQMEDMENLPISRTPEDMLKLTPGVVDRSTGASATGYDQIRGAMTSNNKFLIDGQNVNDSIYGNRSVLVIDDAVQEVQMITGAISAEYGDVDGGVVNTVTKAGGNEFSGSLRFEAHNDSWNAVQPREDRSGVVNKLIYDERFTVGGYLIKDKLWFFLAGYQANLSQSEALSDSVYPNLPYVFSSTSQSLQSKFTYQANDSHSLSLSYLTNRRDNTNNNFASGDLSSLIPNVAQNAAWSLNWMANWTSHLAMEARIGEKREGLTGGGTIPGVSPVRDMMSGATYGNGMYNSQDGGDHRDNRSADLKFSLIWEGSGDHETALGANYLQGIHRAANSQSPTNRQFHTIGYNPLTPLEVTNTQEGTAVPMMAVWLSPPAKAYDTSLGLYVNDKWSINNRISLNLGLRWDQYEASSTDTSQRTGANGWSPRLGVKFDLFGDAKWQVAASFSRYNSAPLTAIVNSVSNAGNPTEVDYQYTGPVAANGGISQANLINQNNYQSQLDYNSPASVVLPRHLRAPHTNEYQVSLAHAFQVFDREAYAKLTVVRRDFKDLFDYRVGNDGTFTPPAPYDQLSSPVYRTVWENSDLAKRLYRDAELEAGLHGDRYSVMGNITWSDLEGNYQGEAPGQGPSGAGFQNFSTVNGQQMYDWHGLNPYGKLMGDVPLRIRAAADYHWDLAYGRTTVGLIYRFDSGQHQSQTRSIYLSQVNPALANIGQAVANQVNQYANNQIGTVIWNSQAYTDLTVQQDFRVLKVADRAVKVFVKLVATNLFNHQQQTSTPNVWNSPVNLNDAWSSANYPLSRNNFGDARSYQLEAGFKF